MGTNSLLLVVALLGLNMSRASRFFENDLPDIPSSGSSPLIHEMHSAPDIGNHLRLVSVSPAFELRVKANLICREAKQWAIGLIQKGIQVENFTIHLRLTFDC
jgi:hypothetical protein